MPRQNDAKVALYLDACDGYQSAMEKANHSLRTGFIELAHARQSRPIDSLSFNKQMRAKLALRDLEVTINKDVSEPIQFFGGPTSLKTAQTEFEVAIKHLLTAQKQKILAERLNGELDAVFHPAISPTS